MWLYLTIPNGAWVVIPAWLAWDSIKAFTEVLDKGSKKRSRARVVAVPLAVSIDSPVASPTATHKSPAPRSPRGARAKKTN